MLGALILAAAACAGPTSTSLVGFWESRNTSKGGIGHTLELRADGVAIASTTVIVDLFYRTTQDRLLVGETADPARQSSESRFQLQNDALVLTGADGAAVRRERLGAREGPGPSIVGRWRYRHYTGGTAYEWYTQEGRLFFRLPMTAYVGCYSVSGGKLTMTAPNAVSMPFELRKGELLLIREAGEPFVYGGVPAGAWYPRDPEPLQAPAK